MSEQSELRRVLAPYVRIGVQHESLYLGFGSIQRIIDTKEMWEPLIRLADHYSSPRTDSEAVYFLETECGLDHDGAHETVEVLQKGRFLIEHGGYQPGDRYSRPSLFYALAGADPSGVQERLASSHVMFLGCGGIGNLLSVTLATAGVGQVTLVDADRVETSNLTRQYLFTEADVGALKCEVLGEAIRCRNSTTTVRTIEREIAADSDLGSLPPADLLVLSADAPGLVELVNGYCVETGLTWLNVCYVNDIAVWGPLVVPGITGCWTCRPLVARCFPDNGDLNAMVTRINRRFQAPSYGSTNMLAAGLASLDVLKHLGGFGVPQSLNRRVGVWTHELRLDQQEADPNPECSTCGNLQRQRPRAENRRRTQEDE
ncbi:bacteriocin biosynthesis cyclodehydratase domain-containing protein [Murinocardiopsis flavida]|uniref:Bacteriocin biosynthesis cyclodehydratase domain-containing protein n=1 Tax=Murinocardiopsis flavida TaxID=645275 RepID=A0A2P8DSF9_9ACTN|nr:TOMM precursor leader peptide-binding protein [Murinocardiopsis flavida]PSL00153.1 bacteriocin biosynthesis cyclodehydratase domain-containing protein [Murinocardiopsis flavida]